jgi:hypothetical protein
MNIKLSDVKKRYDEELDKLISQYGDITASCDTLMKITFIPQPGNKQDKLIFINED